MPALAGLALAVAIVTTLELGFRTQRHPFGDDRFKAIGWWLCVVLLDTLVGLLVFLGFVSTDVIAVTGLGGKPSPMSDVAIGAVMGVLGPLALRSQVSTKQIADKESPIGITYVYDIARVNALYALDERMVRLKRRDVRKRRQKWLSSGLDAERVAQEFGRHLDDHDYISDARRESLRSQAEEVLNIRARDDSEGESLRLDGMIKLLKKERFVALIDELDRYEVDNTERDVPESEQSTSSAGP